MQKSQGIKQIREVKVRDLIKYFYLQLLILITIWSLFFINLKTSFISDKKTMILIISLIISYMPLRCFLIGCILMYQAYAPLEVRDRCRYTPSCSSYTMICIYKYGIIIGVILGIKRLARCKPPYGGYDYPSLKQLFKKYKEK